MSLLLKEPGENTSNGAPNNLEDRLCDFDMILVGRKGDFLELWKAKIEPLAKHEHGIIRQRFKGSKVPQPKFS